MRTVLVAVRIEGQDDTTQIYRMPEDECDRLQKWNREDKLGLEIHAEFEGIVGKSVDDVIVDFDIKIPVDPAGDADARHDERRERAWL